MFSQFYISARFKSFDWVRLEIFVTSQAIIRTHEFLPAAPCGRVSWEARMLYPQEVVEEVRSGNDIVDVVSGFVALKQRGSSHFGLCPFHHEKSPSFSVSADKQMYYCFGCGAGGNVVSFIMQIENYDFMEALKWLADRIHYTLPQPGDNPAYSRQIRVKETLTEMHKKAARFFYNTLTADTDEAKQTRAYLDRRGVLPKTRVKYGLGLSPPQWDGLYKHLTGLGYTPDDIKSAGLALLNQKQTGYYDRFRNRLMFPILDTSGQVIGFGGRILGDGEPKYLNSPETPLFDKSRQLYGLHLARKAKAKEIILVEGYMDVISLYQAGFTNVAGVLGTAFSAEHARLLKRINCESVILLLDSDEAGTAAALRAIPVLLAGGLKVRVLQVTDAKDPDEFLRTYGQARFARLLQTAQSHIAFRVGLLRKKYSLSETDQRVAFTQETAALLATLQSAIETDAYVAEVADMTDISPEAIYAEVNKRRASDASSPAQSRPLPRRRATVRNAEEGLREARKGLINLLLASPAAGRALTASGCLAPEEMGEPISKKLLEIVLYGEHPKLDDKRPVIAPAEIINHFETLEEQKAVAEMLHNAPVYDTVQGMEKALSEMVRVIKQAWLNHQLDNLMAADTDIGQNSLNAAKTLAEAIRNLPNLYITMTDG